MTKEQFFELYDKVDEFMQFVDELESAFHCYFDENPLTALAYHIPTFLNDTFFHVEDEADQDEYYQDFWDMVSAINEMCPEEFYDKWASYKNKESIEEFDFPL